LRTSHSKVSLSRHAPLILNSNDSGTGGGHV
jgi:hypothetical protein